MAQLTCDRLRLGYEGHIVLENLSFSVDAGQYLCIIGKTVREKQRLCGQFSACRSR